MDIMPDGESFNDDPDHVPILDLGDHPEEWSDYWTILQENKSLHSDMVSESGRNSVLVFGTLLIIWSICLHFILCWIVGKRSKVLDRNTNTSLHWLLVSSSVGQVAVVLIVIPVELVTEQQGGWTFGSTLCQWWRPTNIGLVALFFWGHFALTVERYLCCMKTINFYVESTGKRNKLITGLIVVTVWLVAFCCSVTVTVIMKRHDALIDDVCAVDMTLNTAFVLSFVIFFAPTVLTVTASIALFCIKCQRHEEVLTQPFCPGYLGDPARRLAKNNEAFGSMSSLESTLRAYNGDHNGANTMLITTKDIINSDLQKSITVTLVANFIAIICWTPFYVTNLLVPFCTTVCLDPTLWTLFLWFGYSSMGLTPIVWFFEPSIRHKARSVIG